MFAVPDIAKYLREKWRKSDKPGIILVLPGVSLTGVVLIYETADHNPSYQFMCACFVHTNMVLLLPATCQLM